MIGFVAMLLMVGTPQEHPAEHGVPQSAVELANATQIDLSFAGGRLAGCRITATSGRPDIDRYVCDGARLCADAHARNDERRAACMVKSREQLAGLIAANRPIRARY